MKMKLKDRIARIVQLPTVLLILALNASFASVGYAEEIPTMVITAERPSECDSVLTQYDAALGREIKTTAELAVWKTRVRVATDLGVKLNSRQRYLRLAGLNVKKRG